MMTREEAFDVLANAATMVPEAHRTSVFAHAGKVLYDEIERLETEAKELRLALDVAADGSVHAADMWIDKARAELAKP